MKSPLIKPILKYPGAKWLKADWIVSHFPEHRIYIEPYCGSAACFFAKKPSELEILNDTYSSIVNLFRVLREHGNELAALIDLTPLSREEYELSYEITGNDLEDARRFLVRCWQAHGVRLSSPTGWWHEGVSLNKGSAVALWNKVPQRILACVARLKQAQIEHRPALEVIQRFNAPYTLLYIDPPYLLSTRSGPMYACEMSNTDHGALLDVLESHTGMVVLSGYANTLYDSRLKGWHRVTAPSLAEKGQVHTEVLWLNPKAASSRQLPLFDVVDSEVAS